MDETLTIVFEVDKLSNTLRQIKQVEQGIKQANTATIASGGGGGGGGGSLFTTAMQLGTTFAAVATAAVALAAALQRVAKVSEDFINVRLAGGGSTARTAGAAALGAGIGLSTKETGSLAGTIRDAIASGGFARSAASQLGVGNVLPRGMGGPSDMDIFLKLAEGMQKTTNAAQAYNLAIRLQAPELQKLLMLGPRQLENMRQLQDEMKKVFSPEEQIRFVRAQADLAVFWQKLMVGLVGILDTFVLKPFWGQNNELHQAVEKLNSSLNANTAATTGNTVAIGQMRQVFGGGPNAQNALPAGLRGELLRKQLHADAIRLGAF